MYQSNSTAIIAFDVSKEKLDYFYNFKTNNQEIKKNGVFHNQTKIIFCELVRIHQLAINHGYTAIHIVCESSGGFEQKLLKSAQTLGYTTGIVSGEMVSKLKVIEHNDSGKTDAIDARVIHLLCSMDKEVSYRPDLGKYALLRKYNTIISSEKKKYVVCRNQLHASLGKLFPTLILDRESIFRGVGPALYKIYCFNPEEIVKDKYEGFKVKMKEYSKHFSEKYLKKYYSAAEEAHMVPRNALETAIDCIYVRQLYDDHKQKVLFLESIKEKMTQIYREMVLDGEPVPMADKEYLTEYRIARILGETGRLTDFKNHKELLKYSGFNIREKQSGKFKGKNRISKKGRSDLRLVVGEAVFGLVLKTKAYGQYYHKKKQEGMVGAKAMVAVERHLLKSFYSMGVNRVSFSKERLHQCLTQYQKVA